MLEFLVDNIIVVFAGKVFQQIIGIPMGTNCVPLLADIFLYSYEAEFILSLLSTGGNGWHLSSTSRIDTSMTYCPLITFQVLFQLSLDSGTLPQDRVTANVSPLFKKGDRTKPANYRPISLTCILCKTLEHIVTYNLVKHFTSNNILYDLWHGFREKRS